MNSGRKYLIERRVSLNIEEIFQVSTLMKTNFNIFIEIYRKNFCIPVGYEFDVDVVFEFCIDVWIQLVDDELLAVGAERFDQDRNIDFLISRCCSVSEIQ